MFRATATGAVLVLLPVLACTTDDPFVCGVKGAGGTTTVCSRDGEICICGKNRCAERSDDAACSSGWEYVRSENEDQATECVDKEHLHPAVDGAVSEALCSATPFSCGVQQGAATAECGSDSVCLCDKNLCARYQPDDADCASGWRFVANDVCIIATEVDLNHRPDPTTKLCDSSTPVAGGPCGTVDPVSGHKFTCEGAEDKCVCGESPRCAYVEPACTGGLAWRLTGTSAAVSCVPVEESAVTVAATELCKPAPIDCGGAAAGEPSCPGEGLVCVCSLEQCAREVPNDAACESKLRLTGTDACVATGHEVSAIERGGCRPVCGVEDPTVGGPVQCPIGGCLCRAGGGLCVDAVASTICASGFRESGPGDKPCVNLSTDDVAYLPADGESGLCGPPPPAPACGVHEAEECPADFACWCAEDGGLCAKESPGCPSELVSPSGRCLTAEPARKPTTETLCPGQLAPDLPCGGLNPVTGAVVACASGKCACQPNGGVCVQDEPSCPSRFARQSSGICLDKVSADWTLIVNDGAMPCPEEAPATEPCGFVGEAGAVLNCTSEKCLCGVGCLEAGPGCPGGLQLEGPGTCVDPAGEVVLDGLCPGATAPPPKACSAPTGESFDLAKYEKCDFPTYCLCPAARCVRWVPLQCANAGESGFSWADGEEEGTCLLESAWPDAAGNLAETASGKCPNSLPPTAEEEVE